MIQIPQKYKVLKYFEKKYFLLRRKFKMVPPDERVSFNIDTMNDGHMNVMYRGISAIRCPFDYVMYQMIISEVKPDLIIEIGTNVGGTTVYMADLLNNIGHGMIHSMDIDMHSDPRVAQHPRIKLFGGGWEGYDLANTKGFSKILVIEDASHMYEDCIGALNKFSPLVSVGSYYIVEDGIVSTFNREKGFHGGPLLAIREFIANNKGFSVDRKYCDFFGKNATFNVNGYLKRVK